MGHHSGRAPRGHDRMSVRAVARDPRRSPVDALYDVPLSDFVAARNRLVARLRDDGKTADATALKSLAKPKAVIWAINRVARKSPKAVQRVLAAFARLKAAQLRAPTKMNDANTELRAAVEAVVHEALEALQASGVATTRDTHRRIANTLRGAAAFEPGLLSEGRLTAEVAPGGFELLGGVMPRGKRRLGVATPKLAAAKSEVSARADLARRRTAQLEDEAADRERAARTVSAAAREARQRLRELEDQARAATRRATKTRGLAERARRRVEGRKKPQ
jgi:hypothetical protein